MERELKEYERRVAKVKALENRWTQVLRDTTQDPVALRTDYSHAVHALQLAEQRMSATLSSGKPLH